MIMQKYLPQFLAIVAIGFILAGAFVHPGLACPGVLFAFVGASIRRGGEN